MRNFKSLERDAKRSPIINTFEMRVGIAALTLFILASDDGSGFLWLAAFLATGILIAMIVRRKHKRSATNPSEKPSHKAKHRTTAKNTKSTENFDPNPNDNYVKSKSFTDYTGVTDPWEIKDDKPPWEL